MKDQLTDDEQVAADIAAVDARIAAEAKAIAADKILNEDEDAIVPDDNTLPGGVVVPEGYTFVHTDHYDTDGDTKVQVADLLPNTVIEQHVGVSFTIDKPEVSSRYGTLRARLIADHQGRVYILRRDDYEADTTYFKVAFGHNVL